MWKALLQPKSQRTFKILFNLILWGLWIGLPLLSPVHQSHSNEHPHPHQNPEFTEHIWLEICTVVPLFYTITLVLIPIVFRKGGVLQYIVAVILLVISFWFIQYFLMAYVLPFDEQSMEWPTLNGFFPLIMITGIASTYGLLLEFITIEARNEESKNEQMKSELSFLRSQISPHFIFNVLNSIVYLIRTQADKQAEDVTIRLSNLMRYMLYDSDQAMIPLSKELEYLKNYIDLQKMRFEDDVKIEFEQVGTLLNSVIEPMLLIPFVENAFKHGVGFVVDPIIKIRFVVEEGILNFQVENKKGDRDPMVKDESSGIGLKNVRRRLELLYTGRHVLEIQDLERDFKVVLRLKLHKI
ncbi:sensor histidine kinase [Aquirufa rosea]|uniref:Sensor histidine kinase n=1 Tax=Aquirufa rosea TaxID=2509241 RepID=A0A4Q1C0S2_9BACT|nr:histidine kinase [Aquirufa rosea]RXK50729.1 sensor histidine kinase [Aquirufa rosea]